MPNSDLKLFISDWETAPARLPAGVAAWAIGDVHGYLGHLDALLGAVESLSAEMADSERHLVMMGDYVDRGPANIGALQRVGALDLPGIRVTRLLGNHEQYLDAYLNDETAGARFLDFWLINGGLATLRDLGVSAEVIDRYEAGAVIDLGRSIAPASVRAALASLETQCRLGDYLFVHAGVHPTAPLDDTEAQRFTTLREPFLTGEGWIHDFAVVHGHSIVGPDIAPHRVSVDSGCYHTGVLTCVELREDKARFICATQDRNLDGLLRVPGRRSLSKERWRRLA